MWENALLRLFKGVCGGERKGRSAATVGGVHQTHMITRTRDTCHSQRSRHGKSYLSMGLLINKTTK